MTSERDLDRVLDRWMDEGPSVVSNRVIEAAMTAVPTTRQRGARWVQLKELIMTMKPAAAVLLIATLAVAAFAALQLAGGGGIGAPRAPSAEDLSRIVLSADDAPDGMGHDATVDDRIEVLLYPVLDQSADKVQQATSLPGYVAGRYSEFSGEASGILSWAALFDTGEDAQAALAFYDAEVRSDAGHSLDVVEDAALGDEGRFYADSEGAPELVYLWRAGPLIMAVANYGDVEEDTLRAIAEEMDRATR